MRIGLLPGMKSVAGPHGVFFSVPQASIVLPPWAAARINRYPAVTALSLCPDLTDAGKGQMHPGYE
jgi:hypothetical protein